MYVLLAYIMNVILRSFEACINVHKNTNRSELCHLPYSFFLDNNSVHETWKIKCYICNDAAIVSNVTVF